MCLAGQWISTTFWTAPCGLSRRLHLGNTLGRQLTDRYAVAGISRHFKNLYVLFDGVNEKGLAGGALYFKGYADFPPFSQQSGKAQVPALDFLHYVLGLCASLDDLPGASGRHHLVGFRTN